MVYFNRSYTTYLVAKYQYTQKPIRYEDDVTSIYDDVEYKIVRYDNYIQIYTRTVIEKEFQLAYGHKYNK